MDFNIQLNPQDKCTIYCPQSITIEHQQVIQLCYQPIIGVEATALYLKLWIESKHDDNEGLFHHYLLDSLRFDKKQLLSARTKLEGIGLLKTYEKMSITGFNEYRYVLQLPLMHKDFFKDPILSYALSREIGSAAFQQLYARFVTEHTLGNLAKFKEVSKSFNEVFVSISENELYEFQTKLERPHFNSSLDSYKFDYSTFDFKTLTILLGEHFFPSHLITIEIKQAIAKIAFLYNFTTIDMKKIILDAFDRNGDLSVEGIDQAAENHYTLVTGGEKPNVISIQQMNEQMKVINEQKQAESIQTKEGLSEYFDKAPPIEVYESIFGFSPTPQIMRELSRFQRSEVPRGLINSMIHYISLNDDLDYGSGIMNSIINTWRTKGATNAKEALEIGASDYEKRNRRKYNLPEDSIAKKQITTDVQLNVDPRLIDYVKSTPYQYLRILNKGNIPFKRHVQIAEKLVDSYGIPTEVVNVLIEYVWQKSSGNLPENFVESIASELRFRQITDATSALDYLAQRQITIMPKVTAAYLREVEEGTSYDKTIPYDFLKNLYNGKEPVKYILDIAEDLVLKQGLAVGAVNVLIEYAFNETNGKMTKNFIQAIAGNWMLKPPLSALEAKKLLEERDASNNASAVTLDVPLAFKTTLKNLTNWNVAYDETLPIDFMTKLLNGKTPVSSLLRASDDLILNRGLKVGVMNAILEYKLSIDSKSFSIFDIEKIATELQMQQIELANDAIAYIESQYHQKQTYTFLTNEEMKSYFNEGYVFTELYEKYEKLAPCEFMKEFNQKIQLFQASIQTAESYIKSRVLNPAIVNYLLEYTWNETNGKMPQKYVQKVAESWADLKVQTIPEAKKVIDERKKSYMPRKPKSVIEAPKWFEKEKERLISEKPVSSNKKELSDQELEERKRKLMERMKGQ